MILVQTKNIHAAEVFFTLSTSDAQSAPEKACKANVGVIDIDKKCNSLSEKYKSS